MTPAQTTLYFREWGNLTKRCKREGWTVPDRHELHVKALGYDKSSKAFTNPDFDKVLAVFRSYSLAESVHAQVRQERQPRTRLEHRIKIEQVKLLAIVLVEPQRRRGAEGATENEQLSGAGTDTRAKTEVKEPCSSPSLRLCVSAVDIVPDFEAAQAYVAALMLKRFGTADISQLREQEDPVTGKSELEMLRDTLDARIGALRQKRVAASCLPSMDSGWSWHDLKTAAGVECDCAACAGPKRAKRAAAVAIRKDEVAA